MKSWKHSQLLIVITIIYCTHGDTVNSTYIYINIFPRTWGYLVAKIITFKFWHTLLYDLNTHMFLYTAIKHKLYECFLTYFLRHRLEECKSLWLVTSISSLQYRTPPYGDLGLPAYESPAWKAISHTVVLREVMRQTENELIKVKIGTVEMKELIIMIFIPLT